LESTILQKPVFDTYQAWLNYIQRVQTDLTLGCSLLAFMAAFQAFGFTFGCYVILPLFLLPSITLQSFTSSHDEHGLSSNFAPARLCLPIILVDLCEMDEVIIV
jgi:hypothetical protein